MPSFSDLIKSLGRKLKETRLSRKLKETPSEKIMKLAFERDKTYDRVIEVKDSIKTATENKEDTNFLEKQLDMLTKYKDVLGTQIIKLVEETQG